MLTSHEFMLANKKRKHNGNGNSAHNDIDFGNEVNFENPGNVAPEYQNKTNHRKSARPGKKPSGRYNNPKSNNRPQNNRNKDFKRPPAPKVDPDYVPEVIEGHVYDGFVQNYYREKGYGFIRCDSFEIPAFFHYSEIQLEGFKYLIKQQKVEFKARLSEDGKLQAYEVVPTELAPTQKSKVFDKDVSDQSESDSE